MTTSESPADISAGWTPEPGASMSLHADAYTRPRWFHADQASIIARSWQWICHGEKLRESGSYVTEDVAGMPIVAVRDADDTLRAFYNVCKHRAHHLVEGEGTVNNLSLIHI